MKWFNGKYITVVSEGEMHIINKMRTGDYHIRHNPIRRISKVEPVEADQAAVQESIDEQMAAQIKHGTLANDIPERF